MRPGWNAVRRNRKIGTAAQGHGQANELVIPEPRRDVKRYFERITSSANFSRQVAHRDIEFIVEHPRPSWFYPCTPADVCELLKHCPSCDLETLDLIVFRQATRKQRILSPVWGRALYYAEFQRWKGSAIVLEAQNLEPFSWPKSLTPEHDREITRLRHDGHRIILGKRDIRIEVTPDSLRNTLLFRTLLHELGHHVDFERHEIAEWRRRLPVEKEDFAHRYAAKLFADLKRRNLAPFPIKLHPRTLKREGMAKAWFTPIEASAASLRQ